MNWLQQIAAWLGKLRLWFTVRPWEQAIRVRYGKNVLPFGPGMHWRVPFVDEVFVQNTRQRVLNLPVQTVSSKSGATLTVSGVVKWRIVSVPTMYERTHTPDDWVMNAAMSSIAEAVYDCDPNTSPTDLARRALELLIQSGAEFGISIDGMDMTDCARVKTYRLISGEANSGWTWNRVGSLDKEHGEPRTNN